MSDPTSAAREAHAGSDLTLHEAADVLAVHYMTAYRYVRLGLLPAVKSGGVWQIARADLEAFRAGAPLAPQPDGGGRRRAPWAERLEARLLAGDARGAWGVVEAALSAGAELEEIYLEVLSPAMASIGERWARGELDVSMEHRASGLAMRLIGRLGPRFSQRGRSRGAVIVGAPAGEHHSLPVALLSDLLRNRGWEVSDLGADVPHESFVHAALHTPDVVAVGLSVTTNAGCAAAEQAFAALRAETSGLVLVVGGRAVADEAFGLALGADRVAMDADGFADVLESTRGVRAGAPDEPEPG